MLHFKQAFLIFVLFNLAFYLYIWKFNSLIPFNSYMYENAAFHYLEDQRLTYGNFNLPNALGQYDAQWYLRIAGSAYPANPDISIFNKKLDMDRLTFAFFPLYPIFIAMLNLFFDNVEFTSFLLSLVFQALAFYSLYYVTSKLTTEKTAYKTVFLMFFFPFAIFFRSYFTEGLFLILIVWYGYFLVRRDWLRVSLISALMLITRPTGLFFIPLTFTFLLQDVFKKQVSLIEAVKFTGLMFSLFSFWLIYNYTLTGDFLFWKNVQEAWYPSLNFFDVIKRNFKLLQAFAYLPLHDIHSSKVDMVVLYSLGWLLVVSLRSIKIELWLISFIMWVMPVLLKDTTSFSRYQSVSFPLFIFLATVLKGRWFASVASIFYSILLFISLFFINWHWIG